MGASSRNAGDGRAFDTIIDGVRRRGIAHGGTIVFAAAWLGLCGIATAQLITPRGVEFRQSFKAFLYNGVTTANADAVEAGTGDPFVYVEVGTGTLPVAFHHFPLVTGRLAAFTATLALPPWLTPVPVSIVRGTPPRHYITVTIYESGGERRGRRAEWTTYVRAEGDERPRLLMLETACSEPSLDPVRLHAPAAERFMYGRNRQVLIADILSGTSGFYASIPLPARPLKAQILDRHWGAAGDVIYWRNGVADLQNVNGLIANRRVTCIPPAEVTVQDRSPWAAYAESRPEWVVLCDQRIDVSVRPWVNAEDPDLPLDPAFRAQLLATKATVFPALERERAAAISKRMAEPMADFLLKGAPPAIFLNFRIKPDQRHAIAAAIPLPAGFSLAPIQPLGTVAKDYYLSLNVYEAAGLAPGYRAEWSVYVTKDGDPSPRFMIVDAQTSIVSVDPVDVITLPADTFTYTANAGLLSVDYSAPNTSFRALLRMPREPERRELNLDWAECNNLVYWRNGVADKIYYNEAAYGPVAVVPPRNVVLENGTRWARYVELDHVFVYENPQVFVASPWNNLNALQQPAPAIRKPAWPARPTR